MKFEIDPMSLAILILGIVGGMFIYFYNWDTPLLKPQEAEAPEIWDGGITAEAIPECVPVIVKEAESDKTTQSIE